MYQTNVLQRMASTRGGMRNILKSRPSHVQFIKWAIQTGIYKDLHHNNQDSFQNNRRGGGGGQYNNNRNRNDSRGGQQSRVAKYPIEYEILTLNPPIPEPPRVSKKQLRDEEVEALAPTHKLVKNYMRRYDARMKVSTVISDAEREDYYYKKTLGLVGAGAGAGAGAGSANSSSLGTAMGRKSPVLSHAYDFALKQFQVMQTNQGISEEESISIVEDLLANEDKTERLISRERTRVLVNEKEAQRKARDVNDTASTADTDNSPPASPVPPSSTIPSILYSKPRTIQALNIWGRRLQAVPYNQWTLGASTALDHWIAVDVLGMSENNWNRLLDGELQADVEQSRGVDVNLGDLARFKDIVTVRSTLFPETILQGSHFDDQDDDLNVAALEDSTTFMGMDDIDSEKDATERSIDELLASLGGFDEEGAGDNSDNAENLMDPDERVSKMIHDLQDWRAKNEEAPYDKWSDGTKTEFKKWFDEYISLVASESEGKIDLEATRTALLCEPPNYQEESDAFWSQIEDETDAEILLHNLSKTPLVAEEGESEGQRKVREGLATFLSMPYTKQVDQIINLGTLRPILDEYTKESDRIKFMNRYGETLLEGMEIEHLVSDPNGSITLEDIGDESLIQGKKIGKNDRFSIRMVPYGTDEFGHSRSEKARALYQAWNAQKAGRARYAETLFKTGQMSLKDEQGDDKKR